MIKLPTLYKIFSLLVASRLLLLADPVQTVAESALVNEDIIKLTKLELGNDIVIAKINQAPSVAFKLDTDALVSLKQQGVSKEVITAMLNRTTTPAPRPDSQQKPSDQPGNPRGLPNPSDDGVVLRINQSETRLQPVQGDTSSTYAFVTMLIFIDFPGLVAEQRITDRRPTFVVHSSKSPRGRVFLVKCESNKKDDNRSVKVGRSGMFSQKSWSTPDKDWVVEADIKELHDNTWEITPRVDLKPGEYGVMFKGGLFGLLSGSQAELFDFGIDETAGAKVAAATH
jgi:hypothetical protein